MSETGATTALQEDVHGDVVQRIARELYRAEKPCVGKLVKVSSLMNAFRTPSGAPRLGEVERAVNDRGIAVDSGWPDNVTRRTGLVCLSADAEPDPTAQSGPGIEMTIWSPGVGERETVFPPMESVEDGAVAWYDVDPLLALPGSSSVQEERITRRAEEVFSSLGPCCPGLDFDMVRDLVKEDPHPKVETNGDDHGPVRAVSVVGAIAREMPGDEDDSDGVSEEVVYQLVEMIVGPGWIVTCWHPSHLIPGVENEPLATPLLKESFLSRVRHLWCVETERPTTSSDLGAFLARSLVATYDATHRMMEGWMASWEVDFYTSLKRTDKADRLREAAGEISDFLYMAAEIRRRLTAFQHARRATGTRTWFPRASDDGEDAMVRNVRSAKENFDRLPSDIRANMDVLMLQSTATQQESTERVQSSLGWITGVVLVPTLIAGLFGANTRLPGEGRWFGFEMMVGLMVVSAVLVYFFIRKLTDGPSSAAPGRGLPRRAPRP